MDAVLRKQRSLYASAQEAVGEWAGAQAALCSHVASCCAVFARLRLLRDDALYAALEAGERLPELCRRKQLDSLGSLLSGGHEQLHSLSAVVRQLEKLAADSNALLQARGFPLPGCRVRRA
jgi:hypothetical protein